MPDIATWFSHQRRLVRVAILTLLGAFAALGQAPTDLWPAAVFSLAMLFALFPGFTSSKAAFLSLWLFGVGYFAVALRWIVEPFLVDVARHGWMAPFALILMALGAGLFWAIAGWLAKRLNGGAGMLAIVLATAEFARAHILSGFPWALLGHIWLETPLAQLASFGGPHLLSLVAVIVALSLASLLGRLRIFGLVTLGLGVAVAYVVQPAPSSPADGPMVRLVQPNAPQAEKWDPAHRDRFLNRMIAFTAEGEVPDLVVWPETSVPYLLNHVEDDLTLLSDAARGAPLVFGIQRRDEDFDFYNSLVVLERGAEISSIYDKRHLVPFGEYIPGARLLGRMGMPGLAGNLGLGFTPGVSGGTVDLPGVGLARALICYEGIFAEEIDTDGARPRLLLLITNDAWFGDRIGPQQHLAQARLRAIEQGLPMVRVANTGVTAMIDPYGRIVSALRPGVEGALDAALPEALPPTVYSRLGDWPVFAVLLLLLTWGFLRQRHLSN